MANEPILSGNYDDLVECREFVKESNKTKEELETNAAELKKVEKELAQANKALENEKESTIKKRRSEVASKFDDEISKENSRLKKAQNERGKAKAAGVKERIAAETADLSGQNGDLKRTIKQALRAEKLPSFCGSAFYFSLFFTKGFSEVMVCILMFIIAFLLIPGAVFGALYFLVPGIKTGPLPWFVLVGIVFFVFAVLFFFVYKLIGDNTKHKHLEALKSIRELRDSVNQNNKQIRQISRSIKKDKEESMYGLDDFDSRIATSEGVITEIENQKADALKEFDAVTKPTILSELDERERPHLTELEQKIAELSQVVNALEGKAKEQGITLSTRYEAYMGKEFTNISKIDALLDIMTAGEAQTVGEAINVLKNKDSKN